MEIKYVKLQWQKSFAVTSTPATGDEKNAKGIAIIQVPSTVASHFNIPVVDSIGDSIPLTKVKTHEKTKVGIYLDTGDGTSTISVENFYRIANTGSGFKAARIKTDVPIETEGSKKRTTSIRFPRFFDLIMISQALGQMIKNNKPTTFSVVGTRGGTPIYYNDLQSPFFHDGSQIDKGAWIITGDGVTVNTDELTQVAEVSTTDTPPRPVKKAA